MTTNPTDPWNRALRTAMSPARELEPTDAEVQRALALGRAAPAAVRRPHRLAARPAVATLIAIVVGSGIYAVPATRAAVDGLYGSLSAWVGGDDTAAPGRPAPGDHTTPEWVTAAPGEKRLIAGQEGANLYVIRDGDELTMAVGVGHGQSATIDSWRRQLTQNRIVVLGLGDFPGTGKPAGGVPLDAHGRRALMGLASRDVDRVELRYASGPPTVETRVDGGFVLLADARRSPTTLVAYDTNGRPVQRTDVRDLDLRICSDARGCPPGRWAPTGAAG